MKFETSEPRLYKERFFSNKLPRKALVTTYNTFIMPHLDYGDIAYDKSNNEVFINEIVKAQYDSALAITGAIRGTSRQKLCAKLGVKSLKFRPWFRRLTCFHKIQSTRFLLIIIPTF